MIRASGDASIWRFELSDTGCVTALIVDDEQLPLLVEYTHSTDQPIFKLSFAKISYPATTRARTTQEADGRGDVPPER